MAAGFVGTVPYHIGACNSIVPAASRPDKPLPERRESARAAPAWRN